MPDEPATAIKEAPEAGALAAPDATPPAEPADRVAEAAAGQPDGDGQAPAAGEPKKHPWSDIGDPYDVADLPELQEVFSRREARIREEAQRTAQAQAAQDMSNWEATNAYRTLGSMHGAWKEQLELANIEGMERVIKLLDEKGERYDGGFEAAISAALRVKARDEVKELLMLGLSGRARDELTAFMDKGANWPDVIKKRDTLIAPSIREKLEPEIREQIAAEEKARERGQKGEPAAPSGGGAGGGASDLAQKVSDGSASIAELKEARKQGLLDY